MQNLTVGELHKFLNGLSDDLQVSIISEGGQCEDYAGSVYLGKDFKGKEQVVIQ